MLLALWTEEDSNTTLPPLARLCINLLPSYTSQFLGATLFVLIHHRQWALILEGAPCGYVKGEGLPPSFSKTEMDTCTSTLLSMQAAGPIWLSVQLPTVVRGHIYLKAV